MPLTDWQNHKARGQSWHERPGTGAALVLLHGIGSLGCSFAPLLPFLPGDLRVIAWDAPGYGGSEALTADWPQTSDYANALNRLLDMLGIGRLVLVGHSLGALVAANYALDHPERLSRLILASPALGQGTSPGGALGLVAQARIDELQALGPADFAARRAPRLVFQPEANAPLVARIAAAMAEVRMPGYGQAVHMLASGRLLADAARLTVVTDVVTGAEDQVTPPDGARTLFAVLQPLARGQLIEMPGVGHAAYQQAPQSFAEALTLTRREMETR